MNEIIAHLAENLKYYRAKRGLSQRELAKLAGVNRPHLTSIESGAVDNTSLKTVEKLATALGVNALDLLNPLE
ncbi:helix-turn-helix transcriptional regulator [Anaerolineales bacterium HSG6]|nr:helix-turn-helix transcriptional regulator [Anaerolineales bacterium HSG6]